MQERLASLYTLFLHFTTGKRSINFNVLIICLPGYIAAGHAIEMHQFVLL